MIKAFNNNMTQKERRIHFILAALFLILNIIVVSADISDYWLFGHIALSGSTIINVIHILPIILAGLFGYFYALIMIVILFFYTIFFDINQAYMLFIYLFLISAAYFSAKSRTLNRVFPTLAAAVAMALILGNGWYLILCIAHPEGFSLITPFGQFCLFVSALPESLVAFLALHYFYKFAPDNIKKLFFCGYYYTKDYAENAEKFSAKNKASIGRKITGGLILELLLLETITIVLTYVLLVNFTTYPKLSEYIEKDQREAVITDLHFYMTVSSYYRILDDANDNGMSIEDALAEFWDSSEETEAYSTADLHHRNGIPANGGTSENGAIDMPNIALIINSPDILSYSFFAELALMLLTIAIPTIIITNYLAQKLVVEPLHAISVYMQDYRELPEDERSAYIRDIGEIEPPTRDEIWDIYDALKLLVNDVDDYIRKLHNQQTLENNLRIAKAANDAKSNFLSNISHEIRTPINAVLGMNEMILRESKEPETIAYARDIQEASKTLLSLINDILDFSKIEAGMMEIVPVQYDLTSTINDLYNMISVRARDKDLKFTMKVNERMPHLLLGDEIRIKQCILNILTNAVKYTKKGSVALTIDYDRISYDDIYLVVTVKDTGIGIKPEDLDRLFTPFQRIEEERNRTVEGTGLGMSIVRNLLNNMGSDLNVKSVYGAGSEFSFRLLQRVVKWEPIGNFSMMYREMGDAAPKYHEGYRAPDARILVVDDTRMNLAVVKNLLKATRMQVDMVESGMQALDRVEKYTYDVMLIDYRMPEMDGVQTLHAIRGMDGNPNQNAPAIVLTANAISGAREEYLKAGFNDYLSKPVNGKLLEQTIYKYLPDEKIIEPQSSDFAEDEDERSVEEIAHEASLKKTLETVEGINLHQAIENCDSVTILWDALDEFYLAIRTKSDLIEKYASEHDYRNYTILVHSLKGSARLIGAEKLSRDAAYLEECGDHENEMQIEALTPDLLVQYRKYIEYLEPIFGSIEDEDETKEELSAEAFESALSDIKELVEAYDDTSADRIMEMLKGYRIPDAYKDTYEKLREYMAAVDREKILAL